MNTFTKTGLLLFILTLSFPVFSQQEFVISQSPSELGLDNFHKKYTDVGGIPIVSSWYVPDKPIVIVSQMTELFLNKHLKSHDPVLYDIVAGYFPEVEFELSCHSKKL